MFETQKSIPSQYKSTSWQDTIVEKVAPAIITKEAIAFDSSISHIVIPSCHKTKKKTQQGTKNTFDTLKGFSGCYNQTSLVAGCLGNETRQAWIQNTCILPISNQNNN